MNWVLAFLLIAAAVVVARPGSTARERLLGPRPWIDVPRIRRAVVRGGPRLIVAAVVAATVAAGVAGGPVGAIIAAAYAGLGAHEWDRRLKRRRIAARRAADLDDISHLVAELRAGVPPVIVAASRPAAGDHIRPGALTGSSAGHGAPTGSSVGLDARGGSPAEPGTSGGFTASAGFIGNPDLASAEPGARLRRLTDAVWHLAERTGAPAADLLERIERDARAADRSAKAAAAQSAGAQMTALLLAGLPLAGLAMGYTIGGDPVDVLLHTPWGAACAIGALLLQIAGLKWSQRLTAKVTA